MQLDAFDDPTVLSRRFASLEALPESIKTAHIPTAREFALLPDHLFPEGMRKFACWDRGTAEMQVLAFYDHGDRLGPEEYLKTAAHLAESCERYGAEVPTFLKEALSAAGALQGGFRLSHGVDAAGKAVGQMGQNAALLSGGMGKNVYSPSELAEARREKMADVSGSTAAPPQPPLLRLKDRAPAPKVASYYALGDRYPIDTLDQIKRAYDYFGDHARDFAPEDRRRYAVNVVERADSLGLLVPDLLRKYAAAGYAPTHEIDLALEARYVRVDPPEQELLAKLAAVRPDLPPALFRDALEAFDNRTGLSRLYDAQIPDAYLSTYGEEKRAEYSWVDGSAEISESQLRSLAHRRTMIIDRMSDEFYEEFKKDPVGVFKSLPDPEKHVLAQMAVEAAPVLPSAPEPWTPSTEPTSSSTRTRTPWRSTSRAWRASACRCSSGKAQRSSRTSKRSSTRPSCP
jgi:hypothetical protein